MAVGFILFMITIVVNGIARWLVWQVSHRAGGRAA
jgi:ABC-type phosphate transport system permease subunit